MEDVLLGLGVGLGLAAACGFRVFVPLAALSLAARAGYVTLADGFQWMASDTAALAFLAATVLELAAYYIPWFDHALDVVATPTSVAAGVLASAAMFVDLPPLLRWSVAVVAGGGLAGLLQSATVALRLKSTAITGGLGNPVVATVEAAGSAAASAVAIWLPLVALILAVLAGVAAWLLLRAMGRAIGRARRRAVGGSRPAVSE